MEIRTLGKTLKSLLLVWGVWDLVMPTVPLLSEMRQFG